jgi:hypothetical protein
MITLQGFALVAELAAAIWLIVALAGFGVSHTKPWLISSAVAFIALIIAVTTLIEWST